MRETTVKIKQAIDLKATEIIRRVNKFADDSKSIIIKSGGDKKADDNADKKEEKEGKKQFVDLLEAANQACCIEEFKLYVKYKGSKKGTEKLWKDLATPFNKEVDDLLDEIMPCIKSSLPEMKEAELEKVRLEVLKRFCGYLMWREHADIAGGGQQK